MDRQPVESTAIASIGYDASTGTLEIEFANGGPVWQYSDFPEYMWNEFQYAESHGSFFHSQIKNHFPEARVG
jgi:hypothetical protein